MVLLKVMSVGVIRFTIDSASGAREKIGLVTVLKSTDTVAPFAALRKVPAPQVIPSVGKAVVYQKANVPSDRVSVVPVPRMEAVPKTNVPVPDLVMVVLVMLPSPVNS